MSVVKTIEGIEGRHVRGKTFIELPSFDGTTEDTEKKHENEAEIFDTVATNVMLSLLVQLTPEERRHFLASMIRTAVRIQNEDAGREVTRIIDYTEI